MRSLEKSLDRSEENKKVRKIATAYEVSGQYFGADNHLKYLIYSDSISEFSLQAGTQINAPEVRVLNAEQQLQWQGQAKTALLSADKKTLKLEGDVMIIASPNSDDAIHISSERMVYHDDKSEVIGDLPVRITSKAIQQTAHRFRLDTQKETVRFNGEVKASYAPLKASVDPR